MERQFIGAKLFLNLELGGEILYDRNKIVNI